MTELISVATSTEEAHRAASVAVLPVGSFEQHGSHLPLSTDTIVASTIASAIAESYNLLLLPPITISCSHEHAGWAGTVSISSVTLHRIIDDVRESLRRSGIDKLVIVSGHGGNYVLSNIAQEANVDGRHVLVYPQRQDMEHARAAAGLQTSIHDDMHGGEFETSLLMHAKPAVVRASAADADEDAPDRPHLLLLGMAGYTKSGIIGRPSLASAHKGRLLLVSLTATFGQSLDALLGAQKL